MVDHDRYRIKPGAEVRLDERLTADDQGLDKAAARSIYKRNLKKLRHWQERLYAESRQSLLVVLQAMDTAGKDSTIRKVAGDVNPQGCRVSAFKKPTEEELSHDFLWRIHDHAPPRGHIGIFNRSHYEDVLVVRVHRLATPETIVDRYRQINDFERLLAESGTRIVKIMLHISRDYQLDRLRRRLRNPDKHWKFNPADLEERALWDDYMAAYELALARCSLPYAPWYVIPAEIRWFRDAVVTQLLVDVLADMNPSYPPPNFNPAEFPPESLR
ncbi:MAG: polyphosphate kinase 2 family protein [Proteobacteria bacterium]|nr:MAG: polyphosphate kinase 2 family protein [Pseudomonadota bacterium]